MSTIDTFVAPRNWSTSTKNVLDWMKRKFTDKKKKNFTNDDIIKAQLAMFLAKEEYGVSLPHNADCGAYDARGNTEDMRAMIEHAFTLDRKRACVLINAVCAANDRTIGQIYGVNV